MKQILKGISVVVQGFFGAMMYVARLVWKAVVWWGWKVKRAFAENRPQDGAAWLVGGLGLVSSLCVFGAVVGGDTTETTGTTPTPRPMAAALTEEVEVEPTPSRVPSTRATERPTVSSENNPPATEVPEPTATHTRSVATATRRVASPTAEPQQATATPPSPSATAERPEPTPTQIPATQTPVPASPTTILPSATTAPSTATSVPATATLIPPTVPPIPTSTTAPPTEVPPTPVPVVPTEVPAPPPTEAPAPTAPSAGVLVVVAMNKSEEWVDIQNQGGTAMDLAGWVLRSERSDNFDQDCPLAGSIQPGETLRIYGGNVATGPGYNCGFNRNIWNNEELDPAVLLNPQGQEVSRLNR